MYIRAITEEKGCVTVTVCGGEENACQTFSVSKGRMRRLSVPLSEGLAVDEALYSEIEYASAVTGAVQLAARILSVSDKSARMLKRRLTEKGVEKSAAEEAVSFMVRKGYLDEYRQASVYASSAVRTKLHGKRRITKDLYAKGYDPAVIRQVLDELSDEDCAAALQKYLDKTLEKSYNVDDNTMRRIAAAAERMGHSPGEAMRCLRQYRSADGDLQS